MSLNDEREKALNSIPKELPSWITDRDLIGIGFDYGVKVMEQENARLREALEKITDLHSDEGNDMLIIAYKALE